MRVRYFLGVGLYPKDMDWDELIQLSRPDDCLVVQNQDIADYLYALCLMLGIDRYFTTSPKGAVWHRIEFPDLELPL